MVGMSRNDFWSIAATLIVAGAAYFVGGKVTAWGCIGLGAGIILYLLFTHKSAEPVAVSVKQEANSAMTANPSLSQNINLHIPLHPPEPAPRPEPKPRPRPNLQLQNCRMATIEDVLGDHGGMKGFCFPNDQSKPNAAVACIKNRANADGDGVYADNVRATLTFRDENGKEIGHGVNQACWVGDLQNASFAVEESHCVILAIMRDGEVAVPYIKEENTGFGIAVSADANVFDKDLSSVELILVANNKLLMEPMIFDLVEVDGHAGIKLRA
jgi:hypothetical protein